MYNNATGVLANYFRLNYNLKAEAVANKKEILAEINVKDLATKEDLKQAVAQLEIRMVTKEELAKVEVNMFKHISEAKWQVIGVMAFFFLTAIVCKHLGLL